MHAKDVLATGFPPNSIAVKAVAAELKANGKDPVDLYSVLSRFVVLTAMQGDGNAALQFAESLRAQSYDTADLKISADGVDIKGMDPGSKAHMAIEHVGAVADLKDVTPDEWGSVSVAVDGSKISDYGILGVADMKTDTGSFKIDGTRIPIGATLTAIAKLQAISRGEGGVLRVADVLDGLLNMGGLKLTSSAKGVAYIPDNKDDPVLRIGSYSFETGTEGFRDNKGRLFLTTAVDGVSLEIKKLPTPTQIQAYRLFNPKSIHYDLSISELNEPLLRKLFADVVIASENDYAGLAVPAVTYVMALKPMIESKDVQFKSSEVELSTSGRLRFYPAWVIGALPYEGEQVVSISGIDKIGAFIAAVKAEGGADQAGMSVFQSALGTFKALATADGGGLKWAITYPKAGEGLLVVNGTELRFPDVTASLVPLFMSFGIGNAINYTPSGIEAPVIEAPLEVPMEAPVEVAPVAPAP